MIMLICHCCERVIGPVDFAPAPDHYTRVNPEQHGWVRGEGHTWYCPRHNPALPQHNQLPLWEDRDDAEI